MPRITTSDTTDETVDALRRSAIDNRRTPAREALVAVETHIAKARKRWSAECAKINRKTRRK